MNRFLRTFGVLFVALLLLAGCPEPNSGSDTGGVDGGDTDGDGFSDNLERGRGSDPEDPSSTPENLPPPEEEPKQPAADMFVATETFAEDANDVCNDGAASIPCTGEFDTCASGTVGDLLAVQCSQDVGRDGTELSLAVQRQGIIDGGIDLRWGCQAEPGAGTTSCVFDVLENGESLIGGACDFEGEIVDDALVLSIPSTCEPIPVEVRKRIASTADVNGVSTTAAAFLNAENQPVVTRVGTSAPITTDDFAALL